MLNAAHVCTQDFQTILQQWLACRLDTDRLHWLSQKLEIMQAGLEDRSIFTAFSLVPRQLGKTPLNLNATELQAAKMLCPQWNPKNWTVEQTARALLLLNLPQDDGSRVQHWMTQFFTTAGLQELIALHQTLPLLPHPDRYRFWADEGVRSHMTGVFEAIALENPYATWHFEEAAWNQLVLKAIFIDAPLHPIVGLDERRNATLTQMLMDYVHERWAAHRRVTPEIWRLVSQDLTPAYLADCAKGLTMDDRIQALAIARCCLDSGNPEALVLLKTQGDLQVMAQSVTWVEIFQHRQEIVPGKMAIAA
jgi:hypothetical protein